MIRERKSGASLLDSPYLSTDLGLNALLEHTVRRNGGWIEAPRKEGKVTLFSVRTLQRFNPKGMRFTVGVDENGALRLIRMVKLDGSTRVEVRNVRYGGNTTCVEIRVLNTPSEYHFGVFGIFHADYIESDLLDSP